MNSSTLTEEQLSVSFGALANTTRRAILHRLTQGQATVTELAAPFDLSLPAVSKHIKVLEHAGLITRSQDAQQRPCHINPAALQAIASWTDQYRTIWEARFDHLDQYLSTLTTPNDSSLLSPHPDNESDHPQ